MMCLAHSEFHIKVEIEEGKASVLVIENPIIMREILLELETQLQGKPGNLVLSADYEPVSVSKNLILLKDPLNIDCNDKKILTKLYQNIADEEKMQYYAERDRFDKAYLEYLRELCLLSPLPLVYDERLNLDELLKSAHVMIDNATGNYVENLWHYIKVMGDLLHIKVFAFVNLKCFLSNKELELLYKQCFYEQKLLLLIESHDSPFLTAEKKCIVDTDGCVIYCQI